MYRHHYTDSQMTGNGRSSQENQGDKKLKYILSLGKKHIVFFILMMFSIFSMIFLLGILTGYSLGKKSSPPSQPTLTEVPGLDNYNNFDPVAVAGGISNTLSDTGFVSKEVQIGEDFHEQDVLKVKSQKPSVEISPIKNKTSSASAGKNKNTKARNKPTTKSPSPYVDQPTPRVQYYYIQVIATLDVARAKYIYDQLKVRSYPVKVKKSGKDGQYLYAIRVGLYTDKNLARKHLRLIRKGGGYTQAFMKGYRIE